MTDEETILKDLTDMRKKAREIIEKHPIFSDYAKKLKENVGPIRTINRDPENLSTR